MGYGLPGVVVQGSNSSTWEMEERGSGVGDQIGMNCL